MRTYYEKSYPTQKQVLEFIKAQEIVPTQQEIGPSRPIVGTVKRPITTSSARLPQILCKGRIGIQTR
jgi:hypothetical protein